MYHKQITNSYLKEEKMITAKNQIELENKIRDQHKRWEEKEKKAREQLQIKNLKDKAVADTEDAIAKMEAYRHLLQSTLTQTHKFNWEEFFNRDVFKDEEPEFKTYLQRFNVPKEDKFLEFIFPSLKSHRIEKQNKAVEQYEHALADFQLKKEVFLTNQEQINTQVNQQKNGYEKLVPPFVEAYFEQIIKHSPYPNGFPKDTDIQYISESKALIIDFDLPHPDLVPSIVEYKFVQTRKEIVPQMLKKKEFEDYYDDIIYQLALRTIYECFYSDYVKSTELVVFNGWIHGIDSSTGHAFHSCIISLQAMRDEFLSFNLAKVVPKECFRKLKGLTASSLYQLAPVKPIVAINREDKRFTESKEILADINSIPNLADMDWKDFEHLIRQLFEEYYKKEGLEVHVTRASRDGGIDVVAYNPEPILGGKIIIQAKRYNSCVPINDVRALYGVMGKEGAMKGIMVTTSYYGKDAFEYVKGLPITLLDGGNLIHMFKEIGFNVRIHLKNKPNN